MDLSLEQPENRLFVRRVGEGSVTVVDREIRRSFILGLDRLIEDWPAGDAAMLAPSHAPPILTLRPDVVLLGTGPRQKFPPAAFLAEFLRRGIGIESMDNAAAARTHGLLAGEGRRVVAAFILPPGID